MPLSKNKHQIWTHHTQIPLQTHSILFIIWEKSCWHMKNIALTLIWSCGLKIWVGLPGEFLSLSHWIHIARAGNYNITMYIIIYILWYIIIYMIKNLTCLPANIVGVIATFGLESQMCSKNLPLWIPQRLEPLESWLERLNTPMIGELLHLSFESGGITGNTWNRRLRKMLVSYVHIFLNISELHLILPRVTNNNIQIHIQT
mgnify:CR=1 FL=1